MAEPKKTPAPVGHNMVTYPAEALPHSALHIVNHFRGVDTLPLPELGQHASTVSGCAFGLMGGPQPVGAAPEQPHGDPKTLSDSALADILESETQQGTKGVGAEAIPAWLIPILMEAAMRIFRQFFTK